MMVGENCFLLEVSGPPETDDYLDSSSDGVVQWSGRVPGHLRRRRELLAVRPNRGMNDPVGATLVEVDELIIRPARGAPARVLNQPGDPATAQTILVEDHRTGEASTRRYRVGSLTLRAGGGIVDSLLVVLADGDV